MRIVCDPWCLAQSFVAKGALVDLGLPQVEQLLVGIALEFKNRVDILQFEGLICSFKNSNVPTNCLHDLDPVILTGILLICYWMDWLFMNCWASFQWTSWDSWKLPAVGPQTSASFCSKINDFWFLFQKITTHKPGNPILGEPPRRWCEVHPSDANHFPSWSGWTRWTSTVLHSCGQTFNLCRLCLFQVKQNVKCCFLSRSNYIYK